MTTENPTVALVGLDEGTPNFVQIVTLWDGQRTAPFTTAQVQDLAAVLCNQNFLEAFETGRAATNALPLIYHGPAWKVARVNGSGWMAAEGEGRWQKMVGPDGQGSKVAEVERRG